MVTETDAARRRKLRFRAWHRGTKEMDLIMGTFADRHVADMNEAELAIFETLIDVPDRELFAWISGSEPIPAEHRSDLLDRLCQVRLSTEDYS